MEGTDHRSWERRAEVAGLPAFWYEAPRPEGAPPVLYLHGVPTNADDWLPFLERTGGLAPDLPGFGRSGKPADFDYSIEGYAGFLEAFLDELGLERVSMAVHDLGAAGLVVAQGAPERIERLVIADAAPLLPGARPHWLARVWATPVLGELAMGFSARWATKQLSRRATPAKGTLPEDLIDRIWDHFDHGTQRAILRLYRSFSPEAFVRAGGRLGTVRCPALVVWGAGDPYVSPDFAHAYAEALGGPTRVEIVAGAGHWPWIDRPELVDTIAAFLGER